MKGKLIIKEKVYFEPNGLEKPDGMDYEFTRQGKRQYFKAVRDYEALKQLFEVENWITIDIPDKNCSLLLKKTDLIGKYVWDGDPCKAEIKDNKATIISLNK